ncbi:hypothetical protein [Malacoplasma iowae]|uniref:hypothetical protein n=1 Tax=Malacoplasma iowae TaxID=2116 RepID=UPI00387394DA|nr:hypothetical protein QX181_03350 [Malacoplasma iowae]
MINKKLSLLLLSPVLLTTPFLLASCAPMSQHGVAATIKFTTTPSTGGGTGGNGAAGGKTLAEKNGESTGDGSNGQTSIDTEFSKFAYDWTNSKLYKDKKETKVDDNKEFSLLLSLGIIPEISLFSRLITGSHIGFTSSETDNPLFGMYTENGNKDLLKEFLYASANTLNQGRSGEIRLSIAEIHIKASSNFLPNENDKLKVTDVVEDKETPKENTKKYKVSNLQFQNTSKLTFSFTMKYFYSGDSNPFKTSVDHNKVNSYVGSKGELWGGTKATKDSFTLSSKLEVNINPIYSVKSDQSIPYDKTNGVNNSGSNSGQTTNQTKPNNEVTYKEVKDKITLVGAGVQYSYMGVTNENGDTQSKTESSTQKYENDFAKALTESLIPKEDQEKPTQKTGEENKDEPKVEKRKLENGSTLTTWLNKANEFNKVTTNQDIINYRNTLSSGFKKTITLNASTNSSSK